MSEAVELRAVIASKQGLSCAGYFTLANRTKHLRERLYISVRDGDKLFLPQGPEHFPVKEIEAYYLGRLKLGVAESIGAGGGEVLFSLEGPAADEGAAVVQRGLVGLDGVLTRNLLAREFVMQAEAWQYHKHLLGQPPAFRPPVLPARSSVPASFTPEQRKAREEAPSFFETLEDRKRAQLKEWGLLDDYEEMQAEQKARLAPARYPVRDSPQSFYSTPWKESPWT